MHTHCVHDIIIIIERSRRQHYSILKMLTNLVFLFEYRVSRKKTKFRFRFFSKLKNIFNFCLKFRKFRALEDIKARKREHLKKIVLFLSSAKNDNRLFFKNRRRLNKQAIRSATRRSWKSNSNHRGKTSNHKVFAPT